MAAGGAGGVGRFWCTLRLHRWVVVRPPGVEPYWGCSRCGKERMWSPGAGIGMGGG
ncbi:hypothetical protein [Aquipuribacter nitratireducens]|uniref:Uncharacterized protein n=1 Tax=Aquipuribacter nitratireducens TaxID=650104 RepID=A0ABW0GNX8_9MICO